jgi:Co/Zn/Cd efflux system component
MSPKTVLYVAAIALAVNLATAHVAAGGSLKPRIGN